MLLTLSVFEAVSDTGAIRIRNYLFISYVGQTRRYLNVLLVELTFDRERAIGRFISQTCRPSFIRSHDSRINCSAATFTHLSNFVRPREIR